MWGQVVGIWLVGENLYIVWYCVSVLDVVFMFSSLVEMLGSVMLLVGIFFWDIVLVYRGSRFGGW